MSIVRLIRNEPEYPWEPTPRQAVINAVDLRWRSYCLLQAYAAVVGAAAHASDPFQGPRATRRQFCVHSLRRAHDYLRMAAKR